MQTPDEVAAMLRLKALGWGIKRIARELGCSHMTVRRYVLEGPWPVHVYHHDTFSGLAFVEKRSCTNARWVIASASA